MTADEVALWFARETSLQIVFIAGLRACPETNRVE
jgi:hypothetical protein